MGCIKSKTVENKDVEDTANAPYMRKVSANQINRPSEQNDGAFQSRLRKETTFPNEISPIMGPSSVIAGKKNLT